MKKNKTLTSLAMPIVFAFLLLGYAFPHIAKGESGLPMNDKNIFVALAEKIVPSVVNISTLAKPKFYEGNSQEELFRKFFGEFFGMPGGGGNRPPSPRNRPRPNPKDTEAQPLALGTGFIIDASGLILTNNHVVAKADEIKVYFTEIEGEKPSDGKVVGRDPELDLALIKVTTTRSLQAVKLGDSDALKVGEFVMAVGNPFGQGHSVTHGIISAKDRKTQDFILGNYLQTDTPINPGNSGGPLVNLNGEVIGINNAIDQRAQGIGFAIPISLVKRVLPQLKSTGKVSRGYIGANVGDMNPETAAQLDLPKDTKGCFIAHVFEGGPAEKAGVKAYDVVTEINGKSVYSASDLIQGVVAVPIGETATLKLIRDGKTISKNLVIKARPASYLAGRQSGPGMQEDGESDSENKQGLREEAAGISVKVATSDDLKGLEVPKGTKGLVVRDLAYNSPGARAGLNVGDIILEIDKKSVTSPRDFYANVKKGKSHLIKIVRGAPNTKGQFEVLILDTRNDS